MNNYIIDKLLEKKDCIGNMFEYNLNLENVMVFDLSKFNDDLNNIDTTNVDEYLAWKTKILLEHNAIIGIGKYAEERSIYRSNIFSGDGEPRSFHLGIDINIFVESKIFVPIAGIVHSFADNNLVGDYGPTIILEHDLDGVIFYTLYGHLSRESLNDLYCGKIFNVGEIIGFVGNSDVNGGWTPHLHFQIMTDMFDYVGDFPGVCKFSEKEYWVEICIDPNLILGIDKLKIR